MIYIFVALKAEAQPLIQAFKLRRAPDQLHLYKSERITLLITQPGSHSVTAALGPFLESVQISQNDFFYNIGLCAAPSEFTIGSLLEIAEVHYEAQKILLPKKGFLLHSFDLPQDKMLSFCADMEAFEMVQIAQKYFDEHQIHVLKVVSDHFQPKSLNKNLAQTLIARQIKEIQKHFQKEALWPQLS